MSCLWAGSGEHEQYESIVKGYFSDIEWTEMEAYEKASYFKAYENYVRMQNIFGSAAKPPPFTHRQKLGNIVPHSVAKPKKVNKDDCYLPSRTECGPVQTVDYNFSCEKCKQPFKSERLFNNHTKSCSVSPDLELRNSLRNDNDDDDNWSNWSFSSSASTIDFTNTNDNPTQNDEVSQHNCGNSIEAPILPQTHQEDSSQLDQDTANRHLMSPSDLIINDSDLLNEHTAHIATGPEPNELDVDVQSAQLLGMFTNQQEQLHGNITTGSEDCVGKENVHRGHSFRSQRPLPSSSGMEGSQQGNSSLQTFQTHMSGQKHPQTSFCSSNQQGQNRAPLRSLQTGTVRDLPLHSTMQGSQQSSCSMQNFQTQTSGLNSSLRTFSGMSRTSSACSSNQQGQNSRAPPGSLQTGTVRVPPLHSTMQGSQQSSSSMQNFQTVRCGLNTPQSSNFSGMSRTPQACSSTHQQGGNITALLGSHPAGTVREPPLPSISDPDYSFFLNDSTRVNRLFREGLESVKQSRYDVRTIIKACRDGESIVGKLDRGELVFGPDRNKIANALVSHLLVSSGNNIRLVTTAQRSAMAIIFVSTWPLMKKPLFSAEDRPWHHWYKCEENTGFLAHVFVGNQRSLKRTTGEGTRNKQGPTEKKPRKLVACRVLEADDVDDPDENSDYARDVLEAAETVASPQAKATILHLMQQTYERRRELFKDTQVSGAVILSKFKHFISYGGAVINQEFALLHPGKQNMFLREFPAVMAKLLKLGQQNQKKFKNCFPVKFDILNSLLILAEFLPTPGRFYEHEKEMPSRPNLFDLFHIVPRGTDPIEEARSKSESVIYHVQPYILAQGDANSVVELYLVIDSLNLLKLDHGTSVKTAIDLLIKCYFALCMHYPLAWKNVLRYIQIYLFQIPIENGKNRRSSFVEQFMILQNMS